jgi:hypothetical protein
MGMVWNLLESTVKHFGNLMEIRTFGEGVADDLPIEQVKNWGKIEFLSQ